MAYGVIATWKMAYDGIVKNWNGLKSSGSCGDVVEKIINTVEDYPGYTSVGFGGLPNRDCEVELDGAYMNGDTLQFGAIAGAKHVAHPVSVARKLSHKTFNNLLVGSGAEEFAKTNGFETKEMLTVHSKEIWQKRKQEMQSRKLEAYDGHDTIGVIGVDSAGTVVSGTSTSGLFMKEQGRVGDSPLCGCGFYANSKYGGATATGVGEDITKGVLSYEVVRLMQSGKSPQQACEDALTMLENEIPANAKLDAISLIAMNNKGQWGVATNIEFSFVVANDTTDPTIYVAPPRQNGKTTYHEPTLEWIEAYDKRHQF